MAKIHMRLKLVCVTIIVIAQVVSHLRATNAITDDLYDELIIPYDVQMSDSIVPKARFKTHVRSPSRLVHLQRPQYNLTDLINLRKRQLSYVWSPLSEQIFPIRDVSKLSYNDILALTEGYKAQQQSSLLSQTKPSREYEDNSEIVSCRTIRAPIEVTKDDISKSADGSERLIRTCKGLVHINRCEGSCVSSVQPSVKSRTGFRKVSLDLIDRLQEHF